MEIIEYMQAVNLSSFADVKFPGFEKSYNQLEKTLSILKSTGDEKFTSCYIRTLFTLLEDDLRTIAKELDNTVHKLSDGLSKSEMSKDERARDEALKETLSASLSDYSELLKKSEELELAFMPYLFCPAMEEED